MQRKATKGVTGMLGERKDQWVFLCEPSVSRAIGSADVLRASGGPADSSWMRTTQISTAWTTVGPKGQASLFFAALLPKTNDRVSEKEAKARTDCDLP